MIKSTDLRIGNLLMYTNFYIKDKVDKVVIVIELSKYHIVTSPDLCFLDLNPIPLTEEWLNKANLRLRKKTNRIAVYELPCEQEIVIYFDGSNKNHLNDKYLHPKLDYLHQFQNWWYSNYNEELKLEVKNG